ncbi:MAG: response regulator [Bryobacterales bacterium]|nr:response regulator [Bryobacterales bacterium]
MAQTQDALLLREAVTAAKVGNKAAARQLLRQASVHNPNNELVWLWRASLSESPKEAIFYLGEVLRINPQNQKATAWLEKCKGQSPSTAPPDGPKPVGQNLSQPPEPAPTSAAPLASTPPSYPAVSNPSPIPMPAATPAAQPSIAAHTTYATSAQPKPQAVAQAAQPMAQQAAIGGQGTASIQTLAKNVQANAHTAVETVTAGASVRVAESRLADTTAGKLLENRPKPTVIPFVATKSSPAPALKAPATPDPAHKWRCPFCSHGNSTPQKRCPTCHAITILEDLKELEKNEGVQEKFVRDALARYEATPAEKRSFEQNTALALGHLNLREATRAIPYLKAATAQRKNEWAMLGVLDQLQWRKVILVVDDSLTIRKALSSILEKNDYRVLTAEDGSHALEQLNETVPDLVLLDITMPWMDGYQVCKHIKEKALTRKVPVVMLSGKDGLFDKVRGKLAGCNDYVTKPFDPDGLLKTIKKYLP